MLGIQQSVHSAMVTMCACYKGPSVSVLVGRGMSTRKSSWLSVFLFIKTTTKNTLEPRQKQPTWLRKKHCRLSVNIICSGSHRGTPFIPNHFKLGPSVKTCLHQLFTQHTDNQQSTLSQLREPAGEATGFLEYSDI